MWCYAIVVVMSLRASTNLNEVSASFEIHRYKNHVHQSSLYRMPLCRHVRIIAVCLCIIGRQCSDRERPITQSEVHVNNALRLEIEPVRFSAGSVRTGQCHARRTARWGEPGGGTPNSIRTA